MRLCYPPDGSTSPKYKLLCFITTNFFCKEKNAPAFNRDRCCHLVLCLRLIPFHWRDPKSCFGQIFHFKLGRFSVMKEVHVSNTHPCLNLAQVSSCQLKLVHTRAFNCANRHRQISQSVCRLKTPGPGLSCQHKFVQVFCLYEKGFVKHFSNVATFQ